MKDSQLDGSLQDLTHALARLAAPARDQIAYLGDLGVSPSADELALELDDVAGLVPRLVACGKLTPQQAERIAAVHRKLDEMSGQDKSCLWTETGLQDRPEWEEVRRLAAAALSELRPRTPGRHQ
ncbi:MAG: hypothetical protein HY690_03695 [Chloroflexi bacterium]|nr:hypothetical protein [Chloroflexota bacterium]